MFSSRHDKQSHLLPLLVKQSISNHTHEELTCPTIAPLPKPTLPAVHTTHAVPSIKCLPHWRYTMIEHCLPAQLKFLHQHEHIPQQTFPLVANSNSLRAKFGKVTGILQEFKNGPSKNWEIVYALYQSTKYFRREPYENFCLRLCLRSKLGQPHYHS